MSETRFRRVTAAPDLYNVTFEGKGERERGGDLEDKKQYEWDQVLLESLMSDDSVIRVGNFQVI